MILRRRKKSLASVLYTPRIQREREREKTLLGPLVPKVLRLLTTLTHGNRFPFQNEFPHVLLQLGLKESQSVAVSFGESLGCAHPLLGKKNLSQRITRVRWPLKSASQI